MTVQSFVQQGHQNQGLLDAGPYSANQWALWLSAFFSPNSSASGVRASYLNEFEVTNPSGSNILVDTGAAIVNGRPIVQDASLTTAVSSPGANPRVDVVGLCLNNTGIARTTGIASGNAFLFPTDLTDYDSLSSIPPYTVRPVILTGTEAASPVAPTLDSDPNTLFMIPLFQYKISTGGAISDTVKLTQYDSISPSTLIAKIDRSGDIGGLSGSIFFEDILIPQNFKHLKIVFGGVSDDPALGGISATFQLNSGGAAGDTLHVYQVANSVGITQSTTSTAGEVTPHAYTVNPNAGHSISGEFTIFDYASTVNSRKTIIGRTQVLTAATPALADIDDIVWNCVWKPAVPVALTKIGVLISSLVGVQFDETFVHIYGLH